MKKLIFLILFSITAIASDTVLAPFETRDEKTGERLLCTATNGGIIARFDKCLNETEVMTGIRSLEPLMVYCTRLVINCSRPQPSSF